MAQTVVLRNFDFVSYTDKGRERAENEDYLAYFDTLNGHIFVVCDGMGGHAGGAIASEMAVEAVGAYFNEQYYKNPFSAVENAMLFANRKVYEAAKSNPALHNMGTTMVLAMIRDNRVYYGHIGDSRIYLYKKKALKLLTRDHSYVNQMVDENRISEKEALNHPLRNEITKAIGLFKDAEPEISNTAIIPYEGNILLLCTDGLNTMLEDKYIEQVLASDKSLDDKAEELLNTALDFGGLDNISLQLIRFHNVHADYLPDKKFRLKNKFLHLSKSKKIIPVLILAVLFTGFLFFYTGKEKNKELEPQVHILISRKYIPGYKSQVVIYPYRIKNHEKITDIAERFNLDTNYIKSLNPNLGQLKAGKHLKVPIQDIYTISENEDLNTICVKYNISLEKLMRANDFCSLQVPVGKELIIPLTGKE